MRGLEFAALMALGLSAFARQAVADSIDDKRCILTSAAKLPQIQGLSITASSVEPVSPDDFTKAVVDSFGNFYQGARSLEGVFYYLDGNTDNKLKYSYGDQQDKKVVADLIKSHLEKTRALSP